MIFAVLRHFYFKGKRGYCLCFMLVWQHFLSTFRAAHALHRHTIMSWENNCAKRRKSVPKSVPWVQNVRVSQNDQNIIKHQKNTIWQKMYQLVKIWPVVKKCTRVSKWSEHHETSKKHLWTKNVLFDQWSNFDQLVWPFKNGPWDLTSIPTKYHHLNVNTSKVIAVLVWWYSQKKIKKT